MSCGKELIPGAAFCMGCGTPVGSVGKSEPHVEHQRRQVLMGGGDGGRMDEDATVAVLKSIKIFLYHHNILNSLFL